MKKTWQDDLEEWKKSGVFPSVKKDSVEVKVKKQKTLDSSNEANVVKNKDKASRISTKEPNKRARRRKQHAKRKKQKAKFQNEPLDLIGPAVSAVKSGTVLKVIPKKIEVAEFSELHKPDRNGLERFEINEASIESVNWAAYEKATGRSADFFIGLDFGTAFTKVVIGVEGTSYVLKLSPTDGLQPSSIFIASDGRCSLRQKTGYTLYTDLKLPILTKNATEEDYGLVIAFLALIFIECRRWYSTSHLTDLSPDWFVNAGLPTQSYEDERLKAEYCRLIKAAWALSYCEVVSYQAAIILFRSISGNYVPEYAYFHDERINCFPEFVAQITGYVRSPRRRMHSHLIADVGAGTLDVSLFTVKEDSGDWLFRVHDRSVETLGADFLSKHRGSHIKAAKNVATYKFTTPGTLANSLKTTLNKLTSVDEPFRVKVNDSYATRVKALDVPPSKMSEDIVIFVCGGGSSEYLYSEAMEPIHRDYPTEIVQIPKPDRLMSDFNLDEDYHRYSVAYGLSHDHYDIGACIQQHIESLEPANISKIETQGRKNREELYKS
ncbi:hypothetical protein NO989_01105 [Alteromonas sp. DY56-G5]|uniref:hypothetical protein n=1 Tax=Alteromonas sp. DY56-G5 TaxID=2967128 RepID=UPI00352AF89F|tara:strand:+ start:1332 stop:2981 length:1650 start_codon:yes stop_codon:yes gene_type:complete